MTFMTSKKKDYRYPEPRVPFYPEKEPLNRRLYGGAKHALGAGFHGVAQFFARLFGAFGPLIRGLLVIAVFLALAYGALSLFAGGHDTQLGSTPAASAGQGAHQ